MYVSGFSSATRWPSSRTSARLPLNFDRQEPPCRRASSSRPSSRRCGAFRAYSRPGFPSPTTSRSSDEARSPRRHGKRTASYPSAVPGSPSPGSAAPSASPSGLLALGPASSPSASLFGLLDASRHRHRREHRLRIVEERDAFARTRDPRYAACRPSPSRSRRGRCGRAPPSATPRRSPRARSARAHRPRERRASPRRRRAESSRSP